MKRVIKKILRSVGYELTRAGDQSLAKTPLLSDPFQAQFQIISSLKKNEICIFDVGANKGQTARQYRSKFPTAEIYCFEPFPASLDKISRQFSDDQRIHVVPKAVAREKGVLTFYVNERDATNSLLSRPSSGRRYYPKSAGPKETIEVEVINLDEFARAGNIPRIDILKLDIQGGELNALHGAESILQAGSTSLIYTEIMFIPLYQGAALFHEIWTYLCKFGYSLFNIYDLNTATNGQLRYGNAIFVSESVRKNVINEFPEEP